ncbi:MAG TPA: (2Fe-2S) ferredoxin domain-containing protein [Tepidisphaeraceae bacterium]|nr:(2Fe-2S) ferredoxin domain-containing protein [Tepidisphaeraceae bacterium]
MVKQLPLRITICMGSSCFSRGNNRNIEVVQQYLASNGLTGSVDIRGHLCEGLCKNGPNITIADKLYQEVDPVAVVGLLNFNLGKKQG